MAPSVTPPAAPKPREAARIAAPSLPLTDAEPVKAPAERRKGDYTLPPLALLDAARAERKVDERLLMDAARHLEDKCREFSVEGSVVQIHPGPVVTTFELKPDAGVKYSKITGLSDDLSLAMKAESVLIDRIPGKSTVGIQIPNADREQISLREMLESEAYQNAGSKLMMALGKSIHGEPFFADLATMPHLLIAGSTGTGKSVGLNSMLTSILYRATPEDVRLIMIDPKRLELGMYADIPHLLTPVVVDPKLAANALKWAVGEMEHRYKTMAAEHVRNIEQYNRNMRIKIQGGEMLDNGEPPKALPFIVVVIDELADLMMVAGHEVEESICRLAQMARAVGIHLILATQRPSVDVITGLIKANLPARISFRVSSKTDSRTILDANGADKLLGKGDMLFLPPSSHRLLRLHGAYISEQESARLASFLRKQGRPTYDVSITDDEKSVSSIEFDRDELYDEASRIVVTSRPGVDLVPAAPAARRLQPRRAAGRHDGGGRPGVERRRRQGPRRAGAGHVFRRGGQPLGQPGGHVLKPAPIRCTEADHGPPIPLRARSPRRLRRCRRPRHGGRRRRCRGIGAQRLRAAAGARRGAAARRSAADAAPAAPARHRRRRGHRPAPRRAAGTPTTRCGRRPRWRSPPIASTGSRPIARSALELLDTLVRRYPSSSLVAEARALMRRHAPPPPRKVCPRRRRPAKASPAAARTAPAATRPTPPPAPVSVSMPADGDVADDRGEPRDDGAADDASDGVHRSAGDAARTASHHDRRHHPADARFRRRGRLRSPAAARARSRLLRLRAHRRPSRRLSDTVLQFEGPTVRRVRLGRPRPDVTRLAIDLDGVATYTVFALYHPFRLTIDLQPVSPGRPAGTLTSAAPPAATPPAATPPVTRTAVAVPRTGLVPTAVPLPASMPAPAPPPPALLRTRTVSPRRPSSVPSRRRRGSSSSSRSSPSTTRRSRPGSCAAPSPPRRRWRRARSPSRRRCCARAAPSR